MPWPEHESGSLFRQAYLTLQQLNQQFIKLASQQDEDSLSIGLPFVGDLHLFTLGSSPSVWEQILIEIDLPGQELSERERQVCARRVLGYSDSRIAAELIMGQSTVRTHTAHIREKFGLEDVHRIPIFVFCHLLERYRRNRTER